MTVPADAKKRRGREMQAAIRAWSFGEKVCPGGENR